MKCGYLQNGRDKQSRFLDIMTLYFHCRTDNSINILKNFYADVTFWELAWRSGNVMDCHATNGVRFPVGKVKKPSFTSLARDRKWVAVSK